jgi:hypothetical protein
MHALQRDIQDVIAMGGDQAAALVGDMDKQRDQLGLTDEVVAEYAKEVYEREEAQWMARNWTRPMAPSATPPAPVIAIDDNSGDDMDDNDGNAGNGGDGGNGGAGASTSGPAALAASPASASAKPTPPKKGRSVKGKDAA